MATTARSTPPVRRSHGSTPASGNISKGATARSAVSPKVQSSLNGISRRSPSLRGSVSSVVSESDSAAHDALSAALKRETEEKEELLGRIQDKEQIISDLSRENGNITHAINAAESRIQELYADQIRMEDDLAARLELVDRLRVQLQEAEREKRDLTRRYNEQTATFDAERQSFYDNEQHLKSRIQTLSQARKTESQAYAGADTTYSDVDVESISEVETPTPETPANATFSKAEDEEDNEPAEMTALRLELATLSTSHSSLQNTVQMISAQVYDLQRVNNQLQEENESYNILLRERTMNGQFGFLGTVGTQDSDEEEAIEEEQPKNEDDSSLFTRERTVLEPVDEAVEALDPALAEWEKQEPEPEPDVDHEHHRRHGRSRKISTMSRRSRSPAAKGESLADLPVAGPGLDLAAELGRAENQAILEGRVNPSDVRDQSVLNGKSKKGVQAQVNRKVSLANLADQANPNDVDALRNEVKSLKDANKALSLYASKILDRIISQEGFEHVLAVDFDKAPGKQAPGSPTRSTKNHAKEEKSINTRKERSQSVIYDKTPSSLTEPASNDTSPSIPPSPQAIPSERTSTTKSQRRSLSFDWRSFSVFGAGEKKQEASAPLRPLTLRPGATSVISARKLETHEDEDDRKERERMNATLKLMGIEKAESPVQPPTPVMKSFSSPTPQVDPASPKPQASRFSFFRSKGTQSETSSLKSTHSGTNSVNNQTLTQEALERAEAEITLANLDASERVLSEEIAKGSSGGYTELPKRQHTSDWKSRRSKKSGGSGSGSTVWSAGMSTHREGSDEE